MAQISFTSLAEIANWRLYVTDEGRVSCNQPGCSPDESGFLWRAPARRIDLNDFLWALHAHATTEHS